MNNGPDIRYLGHNGLQPYRSFCNDWMSADELEMRVAAPIVHFTDTGGILPVSEYERLIGFLASRADLFDVVQASHFLEHQNPEKVSVFLRHDIDLDLPGAVVMSRIEQQNGFRSSYFILHSECTYYGRFLPDGIFERYGVADDYIRAIHELDQDVGLHIDPLGIIGQAGVNGKAAMISEIKRLRGSSIPISSVCSHNSNSYYNAMNQDVFVGANISSQDHVICKGLRVALSDVDGSRIGIDTLCDFLKTTHSVLGNTVVSNYGYTIDKKPTFKLLYDSSFSIILGQRWEVSGRDDYLDGAFSFSNDEIFEALLKVPRGSKIVLNIHPMYYGARTGATIGL